MGAELPRFRGAGEERRLHPGWMREALCTGEALESAQALWVYGKDSGAGTESDWSVTTELSEYPNDDTRFSHSHVNISRKRWLGQL